MIMRSLREGFRGRGEVRITVGRSESSGAVGRAQDTSVGAIDRPGGTGGIDCLVSACKGRGRDGGTICMRAFAMTSPCPSSPFLQQLSHTGLTPSALLRGGRFAMLRRTRVVCHPPSCPVLIMVVRPPWGEVTVSRELPCSLLVDITIPLLTLFATC